jgi:hypothetical protein
VSDTHETPLPWTTRIWLAFACFFRVLFDARFASLAWQAREAANALPPAGKPEPEQLAARDEREAPPPAGPAKEQPAAGAAKEQPAAGAAKEQPAATPPAAPAEGAALQLLALLQREGRLVDFLEQDITAFSDADVGAAARMVHEGCRKALLGHAKLAPVRSEDEGAKVTLEAGFNPAEVKLIGNVSGSAPYKGVLRHRGWRAAAISLPTPVAGHDASIIAPAEVEL